MTNGFQKGTHFLLHPNLVVLFILVVFQLLHDAEVKVGLVVDDFLISPGFSSSPVSEDR